MVLGGEDEVTVINKLVEEGVLSSGGSLILVLVGVSDGMVVVGTIVDVEGVVDVRFDPPTVVHVAVFHRYVFSGIGAAVGQGSVWQLWLYSGLPAG